MAAKRKREYVTVKSVHLPLFPYTHPGTGAQYWRFGYPDDTVKGGWRYGTRSTKEDAILAAKAKAIEISKGVLDLSNLSKTDARLAADFLSLKPTRGDLERLRRWKESARLPLPEVIDLFKGELGENLTRHQSDLVSTLKGFASTFDGLLKDVDKPHLHQWIKSRKVGPKRRNSLRAFFVQFWSWAKREGYVEAPDGLTVADRLPMARVDIVSEIRFLSPAEMKVLLENVVDNYLPWLVLGAFSAIRSEEIHARNYGDKPPLDWKFVKRNQGIIDLPAVNSKVRKRRFIPITPTLEAWLKFIDPPDTGRIVPGPPTAYETKRLGEILDAKFRRDEGWPRNSLRHSFLTYSAAIRKDLPAIAIEAGTSVSKLNSNYVEATTPDVGEEFFALLPSDHIRIISDKP